MKNNDRLVIRNELIKDIMSKRNLSYNALARKMDVAPSTVWRFVNNKRGMSVSMTGKLLKALELNESDFSNLFIFVKPSPKGNKQIT